MRTLSRIAGIAAVTVAAVATVLFWPSGLGGSTTYVTTHGTSMEPRFHTGDLAVLRSAGSYSVGDVVLYRSATLHTTVMHRIVARQGDRFEFKGDNNSWLDPDHPTADLFVGRLWFRVPSGGTVLAELFSPWVLAALAALSFLLAAPAAVRRRSRSGTPRARRRRRRPSPVLRSGARQTAAVAAGAAVLAAAAEAVLLALSPAQTTTTSLAVIQDGTWSYSGTATPGATYPTGRIATGDPVYASLARGTTMSLTETVRAPGLLEVRGSLRLELSVTTSDGWAAELGSGAAVPLRAGASTASVPLDLPAVTALLRRHATEVGTSPGGATLVVTPRTTLAGRLDGIPFTGTAPPALSFSLNGTVLRMSDSGKAALAPTTRTSVEAVHEAPRVFSLLGHSVPLRVARLLAGVLALVGVAVAGIAALLARGEQSPTEELQARFGTRLLTVARVSPGPQVVDLGDAEALARVAAKTDAFVLHQPGPDGDTFLVRDLDMTYRYALPSARPMPPVRPSPVGRTPVRPVPLRRPPVPVADDDTVRIA